MPVQRVETASFDVCKKAPKLIGYHSNVSSTTIISVFLIGTYNPTNADKLVRFGPVLAEIFGICHYGADRDIRQALPRISSFLYFTNNFIFIVRMARAIEEDRQPRRT